MLGTLYANFSITRAYMRFCLPNESVTLHNIISTSLNVERQVIGDFTNIEAESSSNIV